MSSCGWTNSKTIGLGFGAQPELGEAIKTWVLKPGVYKILAPGQGYNSITNFLTVRLMPGELSKLLLVQNPTDQHFLGGGTVDVTPQSKTKSYWRYGASIGGNTQYNSQVDSVLHYATSSTQFGLLATLWLTYRRQPFEWQTRIRINEGFDLSQLSSGVNTTTDELLLTSLFIWRYFSWLGPYASAQMQTNLLPQSYILAGSNSVFCPLNRDSLADTAAPFNTTSRTLKLNSAFSPLIIDCGGGLNADAINLPFLEAKVRGGFGCSFSNDPTHYLAEDSAAVENKGGLTPAQRYTLATNAIVLLPVASTTTFEIGPQASINGVLRLGRVITADAEFDIFAPVQRFLSPDKTLFSTVSWRLTHWLSLDYTYTYQLRRPGNVEQINKTTNWVWLRFSYSSR